MKEETKKPSTIIRNQRNKGNIILEERNTGLISRKKARSIAHQRKKKMEKKKDSCPKTKLEIFEQALSAYLFCCLKSA
jgi:hypothetical protein